jgi:hypothetical protein
MTKRPYVWATPTTTRRMVDLYEATRPLLVALRDVAKPLAARRDRPVPAEIVGRARELLAAARRVLTHERGARRLLTLGADPDWATLLSALELALAHFASFHDRHSYFDTRDRCHTWRDEFWLSFQHAKVESMNAANRLHES